MDEYILLSLVVVGPFFISNVLGYLQERRRANVRKTLRS